MNQYFEEIENLAQRHVLKHGAHKGPERGTCAMELVAFMQHLPHSDKPVCTCPTLRNVVIVLNDTLNPENRQCLLNILPDLVGTVSPKDEERRSDYLSEQFSRIGAFGPGDPESRAADLGRMANDNPTLMREILDALRGAIALGPSDGNFTYPERVKELPIPTEKKP